MLRFALLEAARLVFSLFGAVVMAAAVASLSVSEAWHGAGPFFDGLLGHLRAFATLDFGVSAVSGHAAMTDLVQRLPETLTLLALGAVIAIAIGAPLGIVFGAGPLRRAAAPLIQVVAAAPVFCAALALAWLAERFLHWQVTVEGLAPAAPLSFADPLATLQQLAVPALTVGAAGAASLQLSLRTAASEVARAPWRGGLRRLGLSTLEIDRVYVTPQVMAHVLANLGELVLVLLSAAAVAEWVFNRPGAAVLFVKSIALADWSVAALVLFAFAAIKLSADFLGAVSARLANPVLAQ
jgi:peptide/nickel transport system permease protein